MSVRLWSYDPQRCDGDYCRNDCDLCPKAKIDEEHIPAWLYYAEITREILRSKKKEQKND